MSTISGTYGFLEDITKDVLARLRLVGTDESEILHSQGLDLYRAWLETEPADGGRAETTKQLRDWVKHSVDVLTSYVSSFSIPPPPRDPTF